MAFRIMSDKELARLEVLRDQANGRLPSFCHMDAYSRQISFWPLRLIFWSR